MEYHNLDRTAMENLEERSNSELEMVKINLTNEYETLRTKMIVEATKLDELSASYGKVNRILNERNV